MRDARNRSKNPGRPRGKRAAPRTNPSRCRRQIENIARSWRFLRKKRYDSFSWDTMSILEVGVWSRTGGFTYLERNLDTSYNFEGVSSLPEPSRPEVCTAFSAEKFGRFTRNATHTVQNTGYTPIQWMRLGRATTRHSLRVINMLYTCGWHGFGMFTDFGVVRRRGGRPSPAKTTRFGPISCRSAIGFVGLRGVIHAHGDPRT